MRAERLAALGITVFVVSLSSCSTPVKYQSVSDAGDAASTADAGLGLVGGCAAYNDFSATNAVRTITWDTSVMSTPQACMTIAVGQTVTWNPGLVSADMGMTMADHPLMSGTGFGPNAGTDGSGNSPIAAAVAASAPGATAISSGATASVTFATTGTYAFHCQIHTTLMFGAINVVAAQ